MQSFQEQKNRVIILTSLFTSLTVIGAFLRIQIGVIPFSLQTFFVLLSGNILGAKYGAVSQALYIILGLFGLPIFAKGGGPAYILEPSFGYLLGFPIASYLVGKLSKKGNHIGLPLFSISTRRLFFANALALLGLFIPGILYLWLNMNYILGVSLSFNKALWIGWIVFLPGDFIKLLLIVFLYRKLQARFV